MRMRGTAGLSEIKAVLFDFGGVLGNSTSALSLPERAHDVFGIHKRSFKATVRRCATGKKTARELAAAIESSLTKLSGAPVPEGFFAPLVGVELLPENLDLVRALRPDYRLAIVANSDGSIAHRLIHLGLDGLFDAVVDSTVVGVKKPDEAFYLFAAARVDCRPEECLLIDDKEANVRGARLAGMNAVHYSPETGRGLRQILLDAGLRLPVPV